MEDTPTYVALSRARRMAKSGEAARLRRAAHLTQRDIAEECGVVAGTVAGWETGRLRPGYHAGRRYAEVLQQLLAEFGEEE
jgi:transcriptional regulator with XRE-family HTH domain